MYICAIREMDVYLYIGMRGNFEKNFLFTLTRSGYMESGASGIVSGRNAVARLRGGPPLILPAETMIGSLLRYVAFGGTADFQPMGANFGILPPLETKIKDKRLRYAAFSERALQKLAAVIEA